jgi:hypothetical protein
VGGDEGFSVKGVEFWAVGVGGANQLWRVKLWSWVELGSKEILGMMGRTVLRAGTLGKGRDGLRTTTCRGVDVMMGGLMS